MRVSSLYKELMLEQQLEDVCGTTRFDYWWGNLTYENDEGVAELQRNTWTSANPILLGMFSRTMAEVAIANDF
jgi:hypothetical protein